MRRIAMLLGAVSAVILATVSSPFSAASPANALTDCSVPDWSVDGEESQFLAIINEYRATNGAGLLTLSESLNRAAAWMAEDMGANAIFGHTDSLGRGPWQRIVDCGYPVAGGENLAAGTNRSSAASAFELFRDSPAHNENMLLARYRQIGIARVYAPGSPYGWYWATTFGTVASAPPPPTVQAPPASAQPIPVNPPASGPAPQPRLPVTTLQLHSGANLVHWSGPETSPASIVARGGVSMLYAWDEYRQEWLRYGAGVPGYVQTMGNFVSGDAIWVIASEPVTLDTAR